MKERPVLFSGPMVRAILEGRKTQTRRVVKGISAQTYLPLADCAYDVIGPDENGVFGFLTAGDHCYESSKCPYGGIGDRLWVRETWAQVDWINKEGSLTKHVLFAADNPSSKEWRPDEGDKWHPSIHMPRWASRITLEITGVRAERLNALSGQDAIAEGIEPFVTPVGDATVTTFRDYLTWAKDRAARQSYQTLWESINGHGSWSLNPWVWVVEFKRV